MNIFIWFYNLNSQPRCLCMFVICYQLNIINFAEWFNKNDINNKIVVTVNIVCIIFWNKKIVKLIKNLT